MIDDIFNDPEKEIFSVANISYAHIKGDMIVDSGGMGGCVSVFIYHRRRHEVFAGHFYASKLEMLLPKMLDECRREFRRMECIEVYVTGAGYASEMCDEDLKVTEEERAYVMAALKEYGFKKAKLKVRWIESDDTSGMMLDLKSGKVKIDRDRAPRNNPEFDDDEPA